jgi:hypothetical protein
VTVITDFKRPDRSPDPNVIPEELVVWNLGRMYAFGKFNDVMDWARRWNKFKYTTAVDGLDVRLAGKGTVAASANLTVYIWTKNTPGAGGAGGGAGDGGGAMPGGTGGPMGGGPGMSGGGPGMSGGGPGMSGGGPGGGGGRRGAASVE